MKDLPVKPCQDGLFPKKTSNPFIGFCGLRSLCRVYQRIYRLCHCLNVYGHPIGKFQKLEFSRSVYRLFLQAWQLVNCRTHGLLPVMRVVGMNLGIGMPGELLTDIRRNPDVRLTC